MAGSAKPFHTPPCPDCEAVVIKPQQMAVHLRAATDSLRREGSAKAQLVRVREQGQRLNSKAVGILGTAIMKQEPHPLQKPGGCFRRQPDEPDVAPLWRPVT